jgi:hypothetical protein
MYQLGEDQYTLQELQGFAKEQNLDFNTFISDMKGKGLTKMQDPEDIKRENLFDIMPGFKAKAFVGIDNTFKMVKDFFTDEQERKETAEVIVNEINNLKPRALNTLFNKVPALGAEFFKRMQTDVDYDPEELNYLKTLDPTAPYESPMGDPTGFKTNADRIKFLENYDSSSIAQIKQQTNDFIKKQNAQAKAVEKYLIKDTGEGIVKGFKQGDLSDFVGGVFRANTAMIETAVPAMLTGGVSLPVQIIAPMYMDYNEAKARTLYGDDEDAMDKLIDNDQTEVAIPTALGIFSTSLEYIGLKGVTKYIFSNAGKSTLAGKLLLSSHREGLTEWGQSGIEAMNQAFAEQKSTGEAIATMWDTMTSEEGLESYLMGFVGSAGVGAAGQGISKTITRALRSDNASAKTIKDKIDKIAVLNNNKFKTRRQDVKEAIDIEIKKEEAELREYIQERRKVAEILNDDQKNSLIDAINKKDNLRVKLEEIRTQLKNEEINTKDYGYLFRSLNNQDKELSSQIETVYREAEQQLFVKSAEDVSKIIKDTGLKGTVTELTSEEISNLDIQQAKEASNQFGFIAQGKDGSFDIILNEDKPALGTAAHELMHGILYKTIGGNQELQDSIGEALTQFVNDKKGPVSEAFVKRMTPYIKDKNFNEEVITVMSESMLDGSLDFNEGLFTKLRDSFRRFYQKVTKKDVEFNTGRDVYNFIKDYNKSIKDGKLSPRILKAATEGIKGKLVPKQAEAQDTVQM